MSRAALLVVLLVVLLGACGPTSAPPPPPGEPATSGEEDAPPSSDPRALGPDARFADLLAAARTLDDRRDSESPEGCLLRRGFRLEADLAVAVRPLPSAPDDLDDELARHPGPVNALSRWGAYGSGEPSAPSFAAVTTTLPPRREPAVVWAITDEGVYVRSSRRPAASPDPIPVDALSASVASAGVEDIGVLFVTAESGTSLARLAEVLALVPPALSGRVGLAVALAPGTRLPAPPDAAPEVDAAAGLCPDGLPETDAPLGELRPETIVQSLGPLRQAAEICVSGTTGPGAAGGRVVLALRIGADGTIDEACAVEDAPGDPALRACLLRATRSVGFPAPSPAGVVDVQLPLVLAPLPAQRQAPLCR